MYIQVSLEISLVCLKKMNNPTSCLESGMIYNRLIDKKTYSRHMLCNECGSKADRQGLMAK